jgi:hypothetical protein
VVRSYPQRTVLTSRRFYIESAYNLASMSNRRVVSMFTWWKIYTGARMVDDGREER